MDPRFLEPPKCFISQLGPLLRAGAGITVLTLSLLEADEEDDEDDEDFEDIVVSRRFWIE